MRLRRTLRRLVQQYTGFDIHRCSPPSGLDHWADISEILSGASHVTAFDVGANQGQTVRKLMLVFPKVTIHAFEPSPSTFSELTQAFGVYDNVTLNNCGVGSQKSQMDLIENTHSDLSSFLEPGPLIFGEVKQRIKVPMTTVDDYSVEKQIDHIHLLKIDVEGFDFEVIKGADRMLADKRIDLLLTEVTFQKIYEGLPQLDAIYAYIAQHNYHLAGVYDQFRKRRILIRADMLFASPLVVSERAKGIIYDTPQEQLTAAEVDAAFRDRCAAAEESAAKIKR
jgi:FkbM family methyltransferase